MSLSFLFCKTWHPSTRYNQEKVWIAEQRDRDKKEREKTAKQDLEKELDKMYYAALARERGERPAEGSASQASVNFMYAPPPGYQQAAEVDAGMEDEAVKKFKRQAQLKKDPNFSAGAHRSELEKLVGRRLNEGLSLAEQQERFPFLKNAPVEHEYAHNVKVNFKPFNKVVNNVKCSRCEKWGHRAGDRDCPLKDCTEHDAERRRREDPLTYMRPGRGGDSHGAGGEDSGGAAAAGAPSTSRGGDEAAEQAFLASLSSKEKRRLLRQLQRMGEGGGGDDAVGAEAAAGGVTAGGGGGGGGGGGMKWRPADSGDGDEKERKRKRRKEKKEKKKHRKHHHERKAKKRRAESSDDSSASDGS